jgi:predicted glycoside hydrolase/deacetylase ChbG (UPF0249 family)
MSRRIWVIADDYGLAPGVNDAILDLMAAGRISGTSCMTGFPEWQADASRLRPHLGRAATGLHLTLTDQSAVTGRSSLAPDGRMPSFANLALGSSLGRIDKRSVHAELDAQYDRFIEALATTPDFIDGHQHVHFLPVVRAWLRLRFPRSAAGKRPLLRGSPLTRVAADPASRKIATIKAVAMGFDRAMQRSGFEMMGPLAGIYDWRQPAGFAAALKSGIRDLPDGGLFMCHPGVIDGVLKSRDPMLDARPAEFQVLGSDRYVEWLAAAGVAIVGVRP